MGLLKSATGKVGCFPVSRKSLLVIVGWAGSSATGPAPLAGGFNPPGCETQPTPALGEKFGGDCAPSTGESAALRQSKPITENEENVDIAVTPFRDRFGRASPSRRNS